MSAEPSTARSRRTFLVLAALFLPGLLSGSDDVKRAIVPTVTGQTLKQAKEEIEAKKLQLGEVDRQPSEEEKKGTVISQSPEPGTDVARNSAIDLVVSSGPPRVQVPDVVGGSFGQARRELRDAGFKVDSFYDESDAPANEVLGSDPDAGVRAIEGSTVTLALSDGPEIMPSVVGRGQNAAEAILQARGIDYGVEEDPNASVPAGIVSRQFPSPGSSVESDDEVVIVVSTREEPSPTPTPTPTTPTPTPTTPSPTPSPSPSPSDTGPFPPPPGGGNGDGQPG